MSNNLFASSAPKEPASSDRGLFGSSSNTVPTDELPDSNNATVVNSGPRSSLFESQPANSTPNLFGPVSKNQNIFALDQPANNATSLFGQPGNNTASLFGQPGNNTTSFFGQPANNTTSFFGQPANNTTGLFGSANNTTGLFRPANTATNLFTLNQSTNSTGLFGQPNNNTNPFVSVQPVNSHTGSSQNLFNSSLPPNASSNFFVSNNTNSAFSNNPDTKPPESTSTLRASNSCNSSSLFGSTLAPRTSSGLFSNQTKPLDSSPQNPPGQGTGFGLSNGINGFGSTSTGGFGSVANSAGSSFPTTIPGNTGFSAFSNQNFNNNNSSTFGTTSPSFTFNPPPTTGLFGPTVGFNQNHPFPCYIPPFEESLPTTSAEPINLTIALKGDNPSIQLIVNERDTYLLSKKPLIKNSVLFADAIKIQSDNLVTVTIETPFPESVLDILLWVYYRNNEKLLSNIKSIKQAVELYSISKILKISSELKLKNLILSGLKNINNNVVSFPSALHRKHVDLEFLIDLLKIVNNCSLFGVNTTHNLIKTAMALEWLGEKQCETEEEVEEILESREYHAIGDRLLKEKMLPTQINEYSALAKRYPAVIGALSIQQLLIGFNLL